MPLRVAFAAGRAAAAPLAPFCAKMLRRHLGATQADRFFAAGRLGLNVSSGTVCTPVWTAKAPGRVTGGPMALSEQAARSPGEGGPPALEPLLRMLHGRDDETRAAAILAVVGIGAPAVPALLRELRSPHPRGRHAAAKALGRIGDAWAVAPLIGGLSAPQPATRAAAARALGAMGERAAVPPLVRTLGDLSRPVRRAAAGALAGIASPDAVSTLAGLASGPDEELGILSILLLGHLGAAAGDALPLLYGCVETEIRPGECRVAIRRIEDALRHGPAELEAASAPAGRGTELEAAGDEMDE